MRRDSKYEKRTHQRSDPHPALRRAAPDGGLLSLKAGADAPIGTQQHIDRLAAAALHKGVGSFKRAFEPVLKMIENADSLEQLRELMEDDTAVAELYAAMDVSEVEELLQKVMLYADLEGRVVEDG